jgi:hypothetical protein
MAHLGTMISEAIVHHYGRDELFRRLAHPFWFQSFGAVMVRSPTAAKDRYPVSVSVPLRMYDQTIQVLKSAVQKAKLGRAEKLGALKRLDDQTRQRERHATSLCSN